MALLLWGICLGIHTAYWGGTISMAFSTSQVIAPPSARISCPFAVLMERIYCSCATTRDAKRDHSGIELAIDRSYRVLDRSSGCPILAINCHFSLISTSAKNRYCVRPPERMRKQ